MPSTRVLSVGQCSFDHGSIARTLEHAFDVRVRGADAKEDALKALRSERFDLVLGTVGFDSKGDVTAQGYVLYVWKDGNFTPAGK